MNKETWPKYTINNGNWQTAQTNDLACTGCHYPISEGARYWEDFSAGFGSTPYCADCATEYEPVDTNDVTTQIRFADPEITINK